MTLQGEEETTSSQNLYERVMGIQDCGYLNDNGKSWRSWMVHGMINVYGGF